MATNPVFLPGGFYGQRRLAGYSLWYHKVFSLCRQTAGAISAPHIQAPRGVSLDPPLWLPRDKGSCLPREANGGEVWVPVPRRLFPLLEGTVVIPTRGTNLAQTLAAPVRLGSDPPGVLLPQRVVPAALLPTAIVLLHLMPYPGTFSEDSLQTENP